MTLYFSLNSSLSKIHYRKHYFYSKDGINFVFTSIFSYAIFRLSKNPDHFHEKVSGTHLFIPIDQTVISALITILLDTWAWFPFNPAALNHSPFQSAQGTAAKTTSTACQSPNSVFAPCHPCVKFKFFTIDFSGPSDECLCW